MRRSKEERKAASKRRRAFKRCFANELKRKYRKYHRENLKSKIPTEDALIELIKTNLNHEIARQMRIGFYFGDIFIKERLLLIEVDGESHKQEKQKARDLAKEHLCKKAGINLLRIKNEDVYSAWGFIEERIKEFPVLCDYQSEYLKIKGFLGSYFGMRVKRIAIQEAKKRHFFNDHLSKES